MFAVFGRIRKTLKAGAFGAAALLALAGCQTTGGPTINTGKAVPVALLVPGGSGSGSDEVIARSLENAARMAISDLDGAKIDLRVYNTAGNPATAAEVAKEAVNDGAKIILGPVYAASANAVGVAVRGRNVNVLAFSNNVAIAGGNVFVLGPTYQNTANRLISYARRTGLSNILLVEDPGLAGKVGGDALRSAAATYGATVTGTVSYELSQNGVIQAIPTIASQARSTGSQALFFTADTSGAIPLLTQLLPENGVGAPNFQFIGQTRWDVPATMLDLPGVQGSWFALPDPGLTAAFEQRYNGAFGQMPHNIAGLAYDGVAAIGALVRQGQSDALTASALTQPAGFAGVNGVFRLMPDGTNQRGLAIATIKDNQVAIIDPAPRRFSGSGS